MIPAASGSHGTGPRRWQLPTEISGFVGRAGELARLTALLRRARLVTVTGPGGIGKTRLALRAAAALTASGGDADFPGGGCLIELSGVTGPGRLPAAIAAALGLRGASPGDPLAAVLTRLRGARMLLILDTCEHLTGACSRFAAQVLRETGEVTILVTSRRPLHAPGEQVLRLGPLPVPASPPAGWPGAPLAAGTDAVALFAQRAAAALPGFAMTAADLPEVTRLCQRLDGIPLGIELAALRVRALPLAALRERLEAPFAMLAIGRRGAMPRQQSLRATVAWSYELCTPAERAVWDRLSAITGPFSLATAVSTASCARVRADQVGRVLSALTDSSVVLPDGDRYRMLSPVREYAAERLTRPGPDGEPAPAGQQRAEPAHWHGPPVPAGSGEAGRAAAGHGSIRSELTSREREIAALVARGLSNREIAGRLVISRRTVDAHISHIFSKLGLTSRVQLTLWVREREHGWVPRPRARELSAAARA